MYALINAVLEKDRLLNCATLYLTFEAWLEVKSNGVLGLPYIYDVLLVFNANIRGNSVPLRDPRLEIRMSLNLPEVICYVTFGVQICDIFSGLRVSVIGT